jgi:hypothetical protein
MTSTLKNQSAFIIRRAAQRPAWDKVREDLGLRVAGSQVTDFVDKENSASFKWNGVGYLIHFMGAPFPAQDIQSTSDFAKFGWESDASWDGSNAEHDIVVAIGTDAKQNALGLTQLCAALCDDDSVISVAWGPSGVFVEASHFRERLATMSANDPPLFLWIAIHPYRTERDIGMVTRGLADFADRELVFAPHPLHDLDTLVERVYDFCDYLYLRGPVIQHGDTVDYEPGMQLRAVWSDKPLPGGKVLKSIELELETVE